MSTFDPAVADHLMCPSLTIEQRRQYVIDETKKIMEMMEGAEECKWIYQALINLSMLHHKLTGAFDPPKTQLLEWTETLDDVDPLRKGRWKDLRAKLGSMD